MNNTTDDRGVFIQTSSNNQQSEIKEEIKEENKQENKQENEEENKEENKEEMTKITDLTESNEDEKQVILDDIS